MSRIDLKGFGGRCQPNDFDDFNFGVLPEDDDLDGEQPNDNIDAINDETFGVDVDEGALDDDLEQYSKQTAGLHLDDEPPKWFDEPTCSVSAPHPSELPTPPFGFNSFPSKNVSPTQCKAFGDFKMQLGTTDTLWKTIDSTTSSLGWSGSELSTLQHSSAYDSINKTIIDRTNFQLTKECSDKNDDGRSLAMVPRNALTLEEVERNHVSSASKSAHSTMLSLPSGAVTLAELEKQLLMQSASQATVSTPDVYRSTVVLPPDARVPPMIPPPPAAPPPPQCLPFPILPPFAVQIARAHLFGQLPELPPGFPPITPQMRAAILSLGPPPVMRMPSHAMLPPFPFVQQSSQLMPIRPAVPSYLPCPSQSQIQSHILQMPHHNMSYSRDRSSKLTGLVSNKTISDFALYPFAGFLSKKERSWLIKIQQLQCQGCGNPYEDDFYYTTWKQRKMKFEKQKGLKLEDEESDYMCCATNSHHCPYVPPTFVGSLGKPTLSTINYPRQLIDLSSDSPDDDDKLSMKGNTSQKKLRALLLQLENVALLIIECDDRRRILSAPSLSCEIQDEMRVGIESRMKTIVETLCLNGRLQAVLLINKGRQMFVRALSLANEQEQLHLLKSFFAALSTIAKKVPSNEMNESLLVPVFETFSHFSKNTLTSFISNSKLETVDATMNLFMTNLLISLLVCCSRQNCSLDTYFCATFLSSLIRPCSQEVKCSLEQYIVLTLEDVKILDAWSANNITGYHGSAAKKLIQNLQLTCRLQESSN